MNAQSTMSIAHAIESGNTSNVSCRFQNHADDKASLFRSEDGRRDVSSRESIPRMADDRIAELLTHGGSLLADSRGGSVPANCQLRY
jgi:hypothetical protein